MAALRYHNAQWNQNLSEVAFLPLRFHEIFFQFQVLKYFLESWWYEIRMLIQNGFDPMVFYTIEA